MREEREKKTEILGISLTVDFQNKANVVKIKINFKFPNVSFTEHSDHFLSFIFASLL